MKELLIPAVAASLAVWLLLPGPGHRLRRLQPSKTLGVPGFVLGREGAPPPRQRAAAGIGAGLVVALLIEASVGMVVAVAVTIAVYLGLGLAARKPDDTDLVRQLPEALDFLAVCLRAGLPMSRALPTVAAVSPEATRTVLEGVSAHLALGRAGALAWEQLREQPVWGPVAADIARAERSGASLAGVLRVHAEDARQERREAATKRARTIGVKSVVPLMVCFLPAFVLVGVVPIVMSLMHDFFG